MDALVRDGSSVNALCRSDGAASVAEGLGGSVVRGDVFDEDALKEGMWGVDIVYHVAGVNDTCPRKSGAMDRVNVDGTRSVIRAARVAGVRRVVYTSSAAAIGEAEGMIGVEHTVHSGEYLSAYARSKHLAELAAFEEAERLGIDLVAVNPSSVQGPGRATGSAEMLLQVLNAKRPLLVDTHLSIVDIEDCTTGHINAAKHGRAGERYILSGATLKVSEAVSLLQDASDRQINPRWLTEGLVRSLGIPAAGLLATVRPSMGVCPGLVRTLLHGHKFDGSKATRDLHFPYTDISNTIARTVSWFNDQGLIRPVES